MAHAEHMNPKKSTILIIEDEPSIQELLSYNLAEDGHAILTADSGEAGLDIAQSHQPSLIVLDVLLPGMTGHKVFKLLKESPDTASIPVIMLSGLDLEPDILYALEAGADDYITKPFSPRILRAKIGAILKRNCHTMTKPSPESPVELNW